MKTELTNFLKTIDPERNLEDVAGRIDNAIISFRVDPVVIETWCQYKDVLTSFVRHLESEVLRVHLSKTLHPDMYWDLCWRLLRREFGLNGEKTGFEIVRTGLEGGLHSVLKAISKRLAEEYAQREISARVSHFWCALTVDQQLAVCDEYLKEYGHFLPSELTENDATRIKANFPKVFEEHPRLIRRFRETLKYYN